MNFIRLLFLCLSLFFSSNIYCMEGCMSTDTSQFSKKFDLKDIVRIDIKDVSLGKDKTMPILYNIADQKTINEIISELNLAKKSFLSDSRPNFRMIFYKKDDPAPCLDIGYQNFSDRPYVRIKYDHKEEEFVIGKTLFNILEKIIEKNRG